MLKVLELKVMLDVVWLHSIDETVLAAEGQTWNTIPPDDPHPVREVGLLK